MKFFSDFTTSFRSLSILSVLSLFPHGVSCSINTPGNVINNLGQDVVFMWNTTNGNSILSATWGLLGSDGKTITPQFIYISTRTNGPVLSSDLNTIGLRYKGRVSWVGNLSQGHAWFKITNLTLQDTNQYVTAIREQGKDEESTHSVHLTVAVPPKFLSSHPNRTYEIIEWQDLKINCTAIGPPTPKITWVNITDVRAVVTNSQGSGSAVLNIDNIQRYHAGVYECQAKNKPNENPTIIKTSITVYYKPTISKELSSSKVSSWNGRRVTISCTVSDGLPPPNITWYNPSGQQISIGVTSDSRRSQLLITTKSADYGLYKCKATNIAGSDEHLINVTQWFSPGPVTISLTEVEASTLTVRWTKPYDGGSSITGYLIEVATKPPVTTMKTQAVVTGLKAGTRYTLKVSARNVVGFGATSTTIVTMKLIGKPSIPHLLAALLYRQESKLSVFLRWSRPDQNGGKITRYTIYIKEAKPDADWIKHNDVNNPEQLSYRIKDSIIHGKTYTFLVTAWNKYGESVRDERSFKTFNTTADIETETNAMEYCVVEGSKSCISSAVLGVIIALFVLSLVFNLLQLLYMKRKVNLSKNKQSQAAQSRKIQMKTGAVEIYENDFRLEDSISPATTAPRARHPVTKTAPEYETISQTAENTNDNEARPVHTGDYQEFNMLPNTSIQGPVYEPLRTRPDESREQHSNNGQHPYEPLNVRNQNTTYQSLHSNGNESAI